MNPSWLPAKVTWYGTPEKAWSRITETYEVDAKSGCVVVHRAILLRREDRPEIRTCSGIRERMNTSTNYFVVPSGRLSARAVPFTPEADARVGRLYAIGEQQYRVLQKFDTLQHVRVWKTTNVRELILHRPTVGYYRAENAETGMQSIIRVEGKDEAEIAAVVERDSEEWIGVKVAKLLEVPNRPGDVDWARYFFFDDRDPASVLKAWDAARLLSTKVAAFRAPKLPGPWQGASRIGDFGTEAAN